MDAQRPDRDLDRLVAVFKALADPARLRILGALAERPLTGKELSERLALAPPTISHHTAKLVAAHLVAVTRAAQSHTYTLDTASLQGLTRDVAATPAAKLPDENTLATDDGAARERAKVLRDFFDGPRLKQIPAQRKKRVIVLQHLLARFAPDRAYPEKEVNALLRGAHDDTATLRRELVDYGYLTRENGIYRVANAPPARSAQVAQEITGDEHAWLRTLVAGATARALNERR